MCGGVHIQSTSAHTTGKLAQMMCPCQKCKCSLSLFVKILFANVILLLEQDNSEVLCSVYVSAVG